MSWWDQPIYEILYTLLYLLFPIIHSTSLMYICVAPFHGIHFVLLFLHKKFNIW